MKNNRVNYGVLILATLMVVVGFLGYIRAQGIVRRGVSAMAVVADRMVSGGPQNFSRGVGYIRATIKYSDQSGTEHFKKFTEDNSYVISLRVGDEVPILYDAHNPDNVVLKELFNKNTYLFFYYFLITIGLLALLFEWNEVYRKQTLN